MDGHSNSNGQEKCFAVSDGNGAQELAEDLPKVAETTFRQREIETSFARRPGVRLINWAWFHAHRREVRSGFSSAVFHITLIMLLACLWIPDRPSGVFLAGETEESGELDRLRPLRIEVALPAGGAELEAAEVADLLATIELHEVPLSLDFPEPQFPEVEVSFPQHATPLAEIKDPLVEPKVSLSKLEEPVSKPSVSVAETLQQNGSPAGGPTEIPAEARPSPQGIQFFGIASTGQRFVFVIDCSFSMRGLRWERATQELMDAVRSLDASQSFYVVSFDIEPHPMFGSGNRASDFVPATPDNIRRLAHWVSAIDFGYETEPAEAIRLAIELQPDAIYLLSDGEFGGLTANYLRQVNRSAGEDPPNQPAVVVHTVNLYAKKSESMLRRIAQENGGTYRFIADPTPSGNVLAREREDRSDVQGVFELLAHGARLETDGSQRIVRVVYPGNDGGLELLGGLTNLKELWLPASRISDAGLARIRQLKQLRFLVLSDCTISDKGLRHLQSMTRLQGLFLDGTQVTDRGMSYIAGLSHLQVLSTSGHLTNVGLENLRNLNTLTTLYLNEPRVTDSGLAALQYLPGLRQLDLDSTQITDTGLEYLGHLAKLEVLDLSNTRIRGSGLGYLTKLTRLRSLALAGTPVSDEYLRYLEQLPNLETLDLQRTAITDAAIDHLARLGNLKHVTVSETKLTRQGRQRLKDMIPEVINRTRISSPSSRK